MHNLREARHIFKGRASAMRDQARLARARGDYAEARELLAEAMEIERELGRQTSRSA